MLTQGLTQGTVLCVSYTTYRQPVSPEQPSCIRECHDRFAEIHLDLRGTPAGQ